MSRKGTAALVRVVVPRVESLDGPIRTDLEQRGPDAVTNREGLVFHVEVGYKALTLMVAIVLQVAYVYADWIANIFGYQQLP